MNSDEPKNTIATKLIDLIKDKLWVIIGTLFSGSLISYIISRLFIRSYLIEIDYSSQMYSTLSDSSNTAVLSFGIFTTLILLWFQFFIVPSLLRYFYFENIKLYEDIHNEYKKIVIGFFIACFLSPLSVLILFSFEKSIFWYFPIAFSSVIFFIWIILKKKTLEIEKKLTIFYAGTIFGTIVLFSLVPFSVLLQAIDYKGLSGNITIVVFIVIWIFYSVIQGILTTINEKVQYILGILIAILIVFEIWVLSPNTINSAITEFIGIKDNGAKIYQISRTDYDELDQEIKNFWQLETICSNDEDNCMMVNANYDNNCTKNCNNSVYLNTQVIFRDNKNAVICPPNYKFGKDMNDRCLLIDQSKLTPTSQTAEGLTKNTNVKINSCILNK